jgi:hypothetical protein
MSSGPDALALWKSLICNPKHERTDRELVQMSSDERTRVFADVGGAHEINPEDPAFVNQCLMKLDEKLNEENKSAFQLAQRMSPHYTDNPGFRIMFLRADNFDVNKCCNRIVRHFEEKLELFGPDKLGRDITLKDLNKDDMEALDGGGIQILPRPDQFGRFVLCSRQVNWKYKHRENLVSFSRLVDSSFPFLQEYLLRSLVLQLRATWYLCMSLVEDENVQRRGIVGLGYSVGANVVGWSSDYEAVRRIINVLNSLPTRVLAVYTCFNSRQIEIAVDVAVHMFNSFLRARFRVISGKLTWTTWITTCSSFSV